MKVNNIDAFPTLVQTVENFLTEEQCEEIKKYFLEKSNPASHELLTNGGVSNYHIDSDFLKEISNNVYICENLKTAVEWHLNEYSYKTGILHLKIDRSWANYQPEGSKLKEHTHPGSFITGVLYISVPMATPLILSNPNPFIKFTPIVGASKYTEEKIEIQPKLGMMVLFPSWILHSTDISYSKERIVISFNSGLR